MTLSPRRAALPVTVHLDGPSESRRLRGELQHLRGELRRLRERERGIFELVPVAIWIVEGETVVAANRAAARLFGVEAGSALAGRPVQTLLSADSHAVLLAQMERVLAHAGDVATVPCRLAGRGDDAHEVSIALTALPDDHRHTTVQMVVEDLTQRRREAHELERSRHDLRRLSARLVEAREEERGRIARELHDEFGQRLTALKMNLSSPAIRQSLGGDEACLDDMLALLDDTVASVRRIAADLRPLMLDDLGLTAAIEWLASDMSRRMGVGIELALQPLACAVDERISTVAYRIAQEALTNVARHAHARHVHIELHAHDDELFLSVCDDGVGLPERVRAGNGHLGLLGMRERAEMLGGRLELGRGPQGGTCLRVRLPLRLLPWAPPAHGHGLEGGADHE